MSFWFAFFSEEENLKNTWQNLTGVYNINTSDNDTSSLKTKSKKVDLFAMFCQRRVFENFFKVSVTEPVTVECQKSPILSQPKTIRFPAKQQDDSKKEPRKHTTDSIHCRWDNCHAHFDTSGALLEHLQVGDDNLYGQKSIKQQREGGLRGMML